MTNTDISGASKIMLGSTQASKMYIGNTLMWPVNLQLPYDAEIEYLESDGNLYIDTGITPDENTGTYLKYKSNFRYATYGSYNASVFGTTFRYNSQNFYFSFKLINKFDNSLKTTCQYGTESVIIHTNNVNNTVETFLATVLINYLNSKEAVITANGNIQPTKTITNSGSNINLCKSIWLFNLNNYNNSYDDSGSFLGKIYAFKISQGSTCIMDLIPVRVGLVGYMYDKVSGQLYGNDGTGSFTLGPDYVEQPIYELPAGWTELEYIESGSNSSEYNGQYIDLNELLYTTLEPNFGYQIKFNIISVGKNTASLATIFGCQEDVSPYPGVFIRQESNKTKVQIRLGTGNNYTPCLLNEVFEYTFNCFNSYNNKNTTHTWGTSLFCYFSDAQNTPGKFALARIYYFKLWKNSKLVRDLIPCKNANNVVGLYDKINDTFYTSPNGVPFYAGPEV